MTEGIDDGCGGISTSDAGMKGNKFSIDHSKNGRAKCKECGKLIARGELRIGKLVSFKDIYIHQFHHLTCAFESFKRARVLSSVISKASEVDGIVMLTPTEKSKLDKLIEQSNAARSKPLPVETVRQKSASIIPTYNARKRSTKSSNIPSMKILFTNADQLTTAKMAELNAKVSQEKPLIIAVTEVKLENSKKERTLEDYQVPGYSLHTTNLDKSTGRGIAILTHCSIDKSVTQINTNQSFDEACLIEIRLRGGDVLLFCCCYRSPTPSDSSDANNDKLNRLLRSISKKSYTHRCIVGDFNYKNINWSTLSTQHGEESREAKFIEAVRDSFLFQHVTEVTRSRGNDNPSLIDLIFSDEEMQVSGIQYHPPLGKSDHSVIIFDYHCYLDYSKPKETFIYNKGDYISMQDDLSNSNWASEFSELIKTGKK